MQNDELYDRREQTAVKHYILRNYLKRFAQIVGSRWESITYVDGFAGPWNARSSEFKDSSFNIALEQLRDARTTQEGKKHSLKLRCLFLEKNRGAYLQLQDFAERNKDGLYLQG